MFTAKKAFDNLVNETKSQNLMVGVVFHTLFALMYIAATYFYATNARHYFLPQKKIIMIFHYIKKFIYQ